jgi:CMP-N-acetylneuraminic acid synthetase
LKYHPLKQLKVSEDGTLGYYDPKGSAIIARQQLDQAYYRNGAVYVFSRGCLLYEKTILPARAGALVLEEPMISIDTLEDFKAVESLLAAPASSGDGINQKI